MLKKLFDYLNPKPPDGTAITVDADEFSFGNQSISRGSLEVIENLQSHGYQAYLVGGSVRDLCLGNQPKDYDVATNATPEEVKSLFRRSRIIGRRFQIVHVRKGREIIEVTTFRANHLSAGSEAEAKQSENGILLRDNVYGTIESDAERRDFTVNALYYDPSNQQIIDFCGGLDDLEQQQLKLIGEPAVRYKEDPVRLLRAIRFAAKLDFDIEAHTEQPISELANYLSHVPPARLFEEVLKLLMSGYALDTFKLLQEYGLLDYLFPGTSEHLSHGNEADLAMILNATANTDKRIKQGLRVTPAFIYAAMLWPPMRAQMEHYRKEQNMSPQEAMNLASQGIVSQQLSFTSIPKRFLIPMREIWSLQLRLAKREGKKAYALLEHPRFRAAYDFLLLREQSGEQMAGLGDWWTKFQDAGEKDRQELIKQASKHRQKRRKPRKNPATTQPQNPG